MKKIPTLFTRDHENPQHVTRHITPGCEWVIDGEGQPTRKYDGTCMFLDDLNEWWARREVKPGKTPPPDYWPISKDPKTGKVVGWEPIAQSPFAKHHAEALTMRADGKPRTLPYPADNGDIQPGTYELVGTKINGNPEHIINGHMLIKHGYTCHTDTQELKTLTTQNIRAWIWEHHEWEGLVWHHPDGRMAKLKRRDLTEELASA